MRVSLFICSALAFAAPATAESPVDGTWKTDIASIKMPQEPDVFLLEGGVYNCSTCKPPVTVKADGAFHKLKGVPYLDEMAIKVVDKNTVDETDKLRGKVVAVIRNTVSADGKTLQATWTDTSAPDGKPVTGTGTYLRVGPAKPGSHTISGNWQKDKYTEASDAALITTIKTNGNVVSFATPNGYHYEPTLGGKPVPIVGDTANTQASVRKLQSGALEETDWRDGKPVYVVTMTPAADGKTLAVSMLNKERNTITTYTLMRQ